MGKTDTIAVVHYDSICTDGHKLEIDTAYVIDENKDTVIVVEKTEISVEKQIIEKLLEDPDYGTGIISVLILAFAAIAILKRWKRK